MALNFIKKYKKEYFGYIDNYIYDNLGYNYNYYKKIYIDKIIPLVLINNDKLLNNVKHIYRIINHSKYKIIEYEYEYKIRYNYINRVCLSEYELYNLLPKGIKIKHNKTIDIKENNLIKEISIFKDFHFKVILNNKLLNLKLINCLKSNIILNKIFPNLIKINCNDLIINEKQPLLKEINISNNGYNNKFLQNLNDIFFKCPNLKIITAINKNYLHKTIIKFTYDNNKWIVNINSNLKRFYNNFTCPIRFPIINNINSLCVNLNYYMCAILNVDNLILNTQLKYNFFVIILDNVKNITIEKTFNIVILQNNNSIKINKNFEGNIYFNNNNFKEYKEHYLNRYNAEKKIFGHNKYLKFYNKNLNKKFLIGKKYNILKLLTSKEISKDYNIDYDEQYIYLNKKMI